MKRALIDTRDNTVAQVEPPGGEFLVSPEYTWVDCPDNAVAYSWTYDGGNFMPPAPPELGVLKSRKRTEIDRDRDVAIEQPVTVFGRTWQARDLDVANLTQEILTVQAGLPLTPVWRDADNNNMELSGLTDLVVIAGVIKAQKTQAYLTAWARKAALDSASTSEEVDAV